MNLQCVAHNGPAVVHEVQHGHCPYAQAQQHTEVIHQQHRAPPRSSPASHGLQGLLHELKEWLQAPGIGLPEELQGVWLLPWLEEDIHRGLETLEEHKLPAFPCRGQADTL